MIECATSCNANYSGLTHMRVQIDGLKLVQGGSIQFLKKMGIYDLDPYFGKLLPV